MENKLKRLQLVFTFLLILVLTSGSVISSASANTIPDYSGAWDWYFYDSAGKVVCAKTLVISDDGSVSVKGNIYIDNVVYLTKISAVIASNGKVTEGELVNMSKLEMVGTITGSFTDTEGKGEWKNYLGTSGTWKATRSDKKVKDVK